MTIESFQKSYLRKTVIDIILRKPEALKTLPLTLSRKLQPNTALTVEDKQYINNLLFMMITDGEINIVGGMAQVKTRYRSNSVEEDYFLLTHQETHRHVATRGQHNVYTVGSERKPFLWAKLNPALPYHVEIIPEPQNAKDPNAIAVCINGQPFSYFPREEAEKYTKILNKLFERKIILTTLAYITEHPDNQGLECFKLEIPAVQDLIDTVTSVKS
jgi:hypothetical protein